MPRNGIGRVRTPLVSSFLKYLFSLSGRCNSTHIHIGISRKLIRSNVTGTLQIVTFICISLVLFFKTFWFYRCAVNSENGELPKRPPRIIPGSKSSDWTEISLEEPDPDDDQVELRNAKLVLSDGHAPEPPPRKNRGIREKIGAVAKSSLQALQVRKPVEEPLFVKKTIVYDCPCDDPNHEHGNAKRKRETRSDKHALQKQMETISNRRKNLSVVSLPNYNELKLSVTGRGNVGRLSSANSLPGETNKLSAFNDKKDYVGRCRSFGSSLPQLLLHKLTNVKAPLAEIESDDSFGGLEDWDLKIIEHYNPRDSSLPRDARTTGRKTDREILSDIETLIVPEDEAAPPKPPVRRSESLAKKINREASESAHKKDGNKTSDARKDTPAGSTPPPSPEEIIEEPFPRVTAADLHPSPDGYKEHSNLIKILQEFSVKNAQENLTKTNREPNAESVESSSSTAPFTVELPCHPVANFLNVERIHLVRENETAVTRNVDPIAT